MVPVNHKLSSSVAQLVINLFYNLGNQVGTLTAPANVYPVSFIPYGNNFLMFDSGSIFTELFLDQKLGQSCKLFFLFLDQSSKPASVATVCPSNL